MFNPFKKKDDGFKLEESSLPSLSESSDLNQESQVPNLESSTSFDSNPVQSGIDSNPLGTPSVQPAINNSSPFNPIQDMTPSASMNNPSSNQDLHNDLIKTKIDSLDSRTALIEAKINSVDQKLNVIYQMLQAEISDETKKKLKLDSMMGRIKGE